MGPKLLSPRSLAVVPSHRAVGCRFWHTTTASSKRHAAFDADAVLLQVMGETVRLLCSAARSALVEAPRAQR